MLVAAISDTHGRPGWRIPPCDVFIHAGDITARGTLGETDDFFGELERRMGRGDVKHALIVPGNHDRCFQETPDAVKVLFTHPNIQILVDQGTVIGGKTFWGSPWTPPFMNWWYMAEEDKLHLKYMQMPQELDVLITHGPPRGYLDPGFEADHVGSEALFEAVLQRRIDHHVFGHLHGAGGQTKRMAIIDINPPHVVHFHNVAAVDEAYRLKNEALEFEI